MSEAPSFLTHSFIILSFVEKAHLADFVKEAKFWKELGFALSFVLGYLAGFLDK